MRGRKVLTVIYLELNHHELKKYAGRRCPIQSIRPDKTSNNPKPYSCVVVVPENIVNAVQENQRFLFVKEQLLYSHWRTMRICPLHSEKVEFAVIYLLSFMYVVGMREI